MSSPSVETAVAAAASAYGEAGVVGGGGGDGEQKAQVPHWHRGQCAVANDCLQKVAHPRAVESNLSKGVHLSWGACAAATQKSHALHEHVLQCELEWRTAHQDRQASTLSSRPLAGVHEEAPLATHISQPVHWVFGQWSLTLRHQCAHVGAAALEGVAAAVGSGRLALLGWRDSHASCLLCLLGSASARVMADNQWNNMTTACTMCPPFARSSKRGTHDRKSRTCKIKIVLSCNLSLYLATPGRQNRPIPNKGS